ncbi:sister chromatid cohesion protein Dcc1 [Thelephora terrestris]|uniref:Sister chromatid cohesion protein Dcc1 n=1 Tax=Thelephora terrestris TaxID=56493 RepID=A0A9P6HRS6_9AGAM|nr:sister chromatid cohesion protein Dcc1 [Thelephora terrestris]
MMAESFLQGGHPIRLEFPPASVKESGNFRLLELPPNLLKSIESNSPSTWAIKGNPTEDAVLCAGDRTYSIRSVSLSNSVLVVGPGETQGQITIRGTNREILQVTPILPKVHKLVGLLRGREYDEGREDLDDDFLDGEQDTQNQQQAKKGYLTYAQALTEIQASEAELTNALKDRRILLINGTLRPIAPSYLSTILELLLNSLVSLQQSHESASVRVLADALQDDHEIKPQVTKQVMAWFGDVDEYYWRMDVPSVLTQVGMGILRAYRHDPIDENEFLNKWKNAVGDTFASRAELSLLLGNYLSSTKPQSQPPSNQLTYFPSSELPLGPLARFGDLFLTRTRWKAEDIGPFLDDIAIDRKERDKLLLTYARAVPAPDGTYYTSRTIK